MLAAIPLFFRASGFPRLSALAAIGVTVATFYYYPFYQGNAEAVDGGAQALRNTQARFEASRAAWAALRPGSSEKAASQFKGGKVTRTGLRTRISFRRTSSMERTAEIVLTQTSIDSPKTVLTVDEPYIQR